MLDQRLRRWSNIEPTLDKSTMFERKSTCPANTTHLYNIYTTSAQCILRWSNISVSTGRDMRQLRNWRSNVSFFSMVVRQMSPPIFCLC